MKINKKSGILPPNLKVLIFRCLHDIGAPLVLAGIPAFAGVTAFAGVPDFASVPALAGAPALVVVFALLRFLFLLASLLVLVVFAIAHVGFSFHASYCGWCPKRC
jgi:hypothetical protein